MTPETHIVRVAERVEALDVVVRVDAAAAAPPRAPCRPVRAEDGAEAARERSQRRLEAPRGRASGRRRAAESGVEALGALRAAHTACRGPRSGRGTAPVELVAGPLDHDATCLGREGGRNLSRLVGDDGVGAHAPPRDGTVHTTAIAFATALLVCVYPATTATAASSTA